MAFNENLKAAREKMGLYQHELADRVGVAQPMIAQYEKGIKVPTIVTAVDIARVLGTTCEELVNGEVMGQ